MKQIYNKLIRDKIVSSIRQKGDIVSYKTLSTEEYLTCLNDKLVEEVNEFIENNDIEELADLFEVIEAIVKARNINLKDVENIRLNKKEKKGAFNDKVFLEYVIEKN